MKLLTLAAPSTEKITEQELSELVIGAIDTAQASIEDMLSENLEDASPKNRDHDSSMLSDLINRLDNITVDDLNFCDIYRTSADLTFADLVIAVVAVVEPIVHPPERLPYNSQRKKSGECFGCDECIPVVVKTLMDRVGIVRAVTGSGSSVPTPGIYCAPDGSVLRNGMHLSWPDAAATSAPIDKRNLLRLGPWDFDAETRQVLKEIENEVLTMSSIKTDRSMRQFVRQLRKGIRRVLKQRLRKGTADDLDIRLVQLHPWASLIEREGWPGFYRLVPGGPTTRGSKDPTTTDSRGEAASPSAGSVKFWFKKVIHLFVPQRRLQTEEKHQRGIGLRRRK